jgi:hypothetical protein
VYKQFLTFAILFLFLSPAAFPQNKPAHWLSYERLFLHISTAHHFNPWKNYNNALETVVRRIQLDSFFFEPTGFYEKINGDAMFRAGIGYRISRRLALRLAGQYSASEAIFAFYPDPLKVPGENFSPAHHQEIDFTLQSFGFGLDFTHPVSRKFLIHAFGSVDRYHARMNIDFRHSRAWRGPLPENEGWRVSADLQENKWGFHGFLGAGLRLYGPLQVNAGIAFRAISFARLQGPATDGTFAHRPFIAHLVEAENYFGIGVKSSPADYEPFLPDLTFLTEPGVDARVPATLDLTSFGPQIELKIGF